MAAQWAQDVQTAFQGDSALTARILDTANRYQGELPALFGDIAKYMLSSTATTSTSQQAHSKKRKLAEGSQSQQVSTNGPSTPAAAITRPLVAFECQNVSFQVPARKKLKLQLVTDQADAATGEVRLLNPASNEAEYVLSSTQIDQIFCLPVPEKQQRQSSFVIFPQPGATTADGMPLDQVVFTLNETKPDDATSTSRQKQEGDNYVTVTEPELNRMLQAQGKRVVRPSEAEFASSIVQAHRKGEKAYHVKAHRGSKEGYLFFLPIGIVFGFKKPLSFFPFSAVDSISYTSVLQRTFNLVISATEAHSTEAKDIEFGMIDQADFAGIDEYIKRHGLNDASMAAERRAKAYNVNKEKKTETNGEANGVAGAEVDDDGLTDLQRAEQQLQDQEDEEEEDYEESGGESDGSGEESEEDEEGYEDAEGEDYGEDEGEEE